MSSPPLTLGWLSACRALGVGTLVACGSTAVPTETTEGPGCPGVTATLNVEMPLVVDLSWEDDGAAAVSFGVDGAFDRVLLTDAGPIHHVQLLDFPEETIVAFEVEPEDGAWVCRGEVETGTMPTWLPAESSLLRDDGAADDLDPEDDGRYLLGSVFGMEGFAFAANREGHWVWAERIPEDHVSVQTERAVDGSGIIYATATVDLNDDEAAVHYRSLAGEQGLSVSMTDGHHVFAQHPDGTLAYLALDVRDWQDPDTGEWEPVVGDAIIEVAPDGSTQVVSSTWDWLEVVRTPGFSLSLYPQGADWTHANALKYDPETETYLMSFYQLNAVTQIDRATGLPTLWVTSDPGLPVPEGAEVYVAEGAFEHPHDPSLTDDGNLLLFSTQTQSRAVEFAFEDGTLREVWSYGEEVDEISMVLGQAQRLDNGDTLFNVATLAHVQQVSATGELRWGIDMGEIRLGQVQLVHDLGTGEVFGP